MGLIDLGVAGTINTEHVVSDSERDADGHLILRFDDSLKGEVLALSEEEEAHYNAERPPYRTAEQEAKYNAGLEKKTARKARQQSAEV